MIRLEAAAMLFKTRDTNFQQVVNACHVLKTWVLFTKTRHLKKQISQMIRSFLFVFVFFENLPDDLIAFFHLLYKIENIFIDILHVYDRLMHDNLPSCLQVTE